jgi:hypothetical protein
LSRDKSVGGATFPDVMPSGGTISGVGDGAVADFAAEKSGCLMPVAINIAVKRSAAAK